MNFLIDLFKKATKGDNFRSPQSVDKYNDSIAQLNSLGSDQYNKVNTQTINRISKTKSSLTQTKSNSTPAGSR